MHTAITTTETDTGQAGHTSTAAGPIIRLRGVTKTYGTVRAVNGIDLEIRRGETVALLGPNGAGKTTTISMLLGLLTPTSGSVEIFGMAPDQAIQQSRPGYLHRAMQQGVVGFLVKDAPAAQLATAIRRAVAGERIVDPLLAAAALGEGDNPLTERERGVLQMVQRGASNAEIATKLALSEGTVRNYLSTAMQKLHAATRVEAAVRAEQQGWL